MTEAEQRAAVIAEAITWLRTPFIDCARVKGAGCDCAQFIAGAFENSGIAKTNVLRFYSPQWNLHSPEELYIDGLLANGCREITEAEVKPADIVVYKQGRTYSHGALIVEWPRRVIHAVKFMGGVVYSDTTQDRFLTLRPRRFFSFWGDK